MPAFDAEVIVVGAGPAGAVAARTLADAGVDTILLDRASFPRNKPCGGGITSRALSRFPWLGSALQEIDVHRVARLHLEGPHGTSVDIDSGDPCVLLVRRLEFDHALVRAAGHSGARQLSGLEITQAEATRDRVTLRARDGRRLSAPFVIAADGVHSVIAKRLGVNPRWPRASLAIDMMEETPVDVLRPDRPDVLWVAYAHNGLDGYAYVFPKTRHTNAGVGCVLTHFDQEVPGAPYELQSQFVSSMVDRHILHGRSDRQCFTPFLIPVGGPLQRAWHGRVLFAGDAGGFVHALTAEGIYYAMVSGELAGNAIARTRTAVMSDTVGRTYERAWKAELGAELRDAVVAQRYLFRNHARVARIIRRAGRASGLTRAILEYVKGGRSYHAIRRRLLWSFPMSIWRMVSERPDAARSRKAS